MEPPKVSRREAEVLAAIGGHLSNSEIAAELGVSIRTVESHVSRLLRKFGVPDRRTLARTASAGDGRLPGLPATHTSFVGRAHEVDAAVPAVRGPGLVTLVGPGGVGKTRLACVLAERAAPSFADAGGYVDLVPVSPTFAVPAVAAALEVPEVPRQPITRSVAAFLAGRHALIVLDNCEHALDELAPLVDRILAAGPRVTVLATSRERLGLPGERVVPVGPLPLASDAEALFTARARAADPRFAADPAVVAAICARLDGLPLAIELAAARTASLGAQGLLAALDDILRAVSGGRTEDRRHTSLSAVLEWSHQLLTEEEQRLFSAVSVFCGGFDLAAATAVCVGDQAGEDSAARVADVLGRLTDKSLLMRDVRSPRWRMLRTIRAFAAGRLDDGLRAPLVRRHLAWAVDRAENALDGGSEFELVADDLRAALAAAEPGPQGQRLAWALARLAYARRLLRESVTHFRRAAELALDDHQASVALRTAGHAAFAIDRAEQSYALLLESGARGSGRDAAIAWCEAVLTASRFPSGFSRPVPESQIALLLAAAADAASADVQALAYLDAARLWAGDPTASLEQAEKSARATGDSILMSAVLAAAPGAAATAERMRLLPRMDLEDPRFAAELLEIWHSAWLAALDAGRPREALDIAESIRDHGLLGTHPYRPAGKLIPPLVLLGRFDEAVALAEPMWRAWRRSGVPAAALLSPAASCIALVHGLRGEESARRTWTRRALRAVGAGSASGLRAYHDPCARFGALRLAVHRGGRDGDDYDDYDSHDRHDGHGDHDGRDRVDAPGSASFDMSAYITAAAAELAVVTGAPDAADRLLRARRATGGHPWATACLTRARGRLDSDPKALTEAVTLWSDLGARFERAETLVLTRDRDEGRAELRALGISPDRPDRGLHQHL